MSGPIATLLPDDKPRRLPWHRRWRRALLWVGGIGLTILVGGWLFLNSTLYFRGIILPRLEEKLRAQITIQDIDWSLLEGITMRGLVVQTVGDEPVFKAEELRLRARAWDLGEGPIISQLHLIDPALNVVVAEDGTSNFDSIREALRGTDDGKTPEISDISIKNGVFLFTRESKISGLHDLSFDLSRWSDGAAGEVVLAANVSHMEGANKILGEFNLEGSLTGSGGHRPVQFQGRAGLELREGEGNYTDWSDVSLRLQGDLEADALRGFRLDLTDGIKSGTLQAQGKRESTGDWVIDLKTDGLVRRILPLSGIELADVMGEVAINGAHTVRLNSSGLETVGNFNVGTTLPAIQWTMGYQFVADYSERRVIFDSITLEGRQNQNVVMTGALEEPLRLDWTQTGFALGDIGCVFETKRLNLSQWRGIMGHKLDAGTLDLKLQARIVPAEKIMDYDLAATIGRLRGEAFHRIFSDEDISINVRGRLMPDGLSMHDSALRHLKRKGGTRAAISQLEELSMKWLFSSGGTSEGQLTASLSHSNGKDQFSGHLSTQGLFDINLAGLLVKADANATMEIDAAEGIFASARNLSGNARLELVPNSLRELAIDFSKLGEAFGRVTASGFRDVPSGNWALDCNISGVDRRVLNLVAAGHDLDFCGTVFSSTNRVRFTPGGVKFGVTGRTIADQFSLAREGVTTPVLDVTADYSLNLDWPAQRIEVAKLKLTGVQNDQPMLTGRLLQPMQLAWGAQLVGEGASKLELELKSIDLAHWRPLIGNYAESGKVDAQLILTASQAGRDLEYNLKSSATGLATPWFKKLEGTLESGGRLMDFSKLTIQECDAQWHWSGESRHSMGGSGTVDFSKGGEIIRATVDGWVQAEGQEVASEYAGTFTRDILQSTRRVKFNARKVPPLLLQRICGNRIDVLTGKGAIDGEIVENVAGTRIIKAYAKIDDLRLKHPEWPGSETGLQMEFEGYLKNNSNGQLRIECKGANGSLRSADQLLGEINATGVAQFGLEKGQAEVVLNQLKLTDIDPALVRLVGGRKWINGVLGYAGELKWNQGKTLLLNGRFDVRGLKVDTLNWPKESVDLFVSGPIIVQPNDAYWRMLRAGDLDASFILGNKPYGQIEFRTDMPGSYTLRLKAFSVVLFRLAEPLLSKAWGVNGGQGDADIDVTWNSKTGLRFKGVAEVKDWVVRDRRGGVSQPASASAVFDISHHDSKLSINECLVNLGGTKLAGNHVELEAKYDFSKSDKVEGQVRARSDELELERVLDILKAEPKSRQSGGRTLVVDMQLEADRLHWHGLTATNSVATASLIGAVTEFSKIQMYLEGGRLGAYYRQDRSQSTWTHDLAIIGREVSMPPLLDLFVTDRYKKWVTAQRWGNLDADFRMRWAQIPKAGWDWRSVDLEGLKGGGSDAVFRISGAGIEVPKGDESTGLLPDVLRMVVVTIARSLRVPELRQAKVESASLVGRIEDKQIQARVKMHTPKYISEVGGKSTMQKRLSDMPLLGLPVQCSLMPEVARKNRLSGTLFGGGKHLRLPIFCKLKGTLADMRIETDPIVLGAIFTAGLSDTVINVPANVLEEASGVLDQLPVPVNPLNIFFPRKK